MVRWIALIGMLMLLVGAWPLFEFQNIWPFNADRVVVLRSMLALGVLATIEPPRVRRRPWVVSHAAISMLSAAGGMLPIGSSSRR